MKRKRKNGNYIIPLSDKYPPSEPCGCDICKAYCKRPGWWTVEEAEKAIDMGYGGRMMLEMSPDRSFGVLSPAFLGCDGYFALKEFSENGCNFLKDGLCELFGTGIEPLECRYCHHDRKGMGQSCHLDLELEWRKAKGQNLVRKWTERYLKSK